MLTLRRSYLTAFPQKTVIHIFLRQQFMFLECSLGNRISFFLFLSLSEHSAECVCVCGHEHRKDKAEQKVVSKLENCHITCVEKKELYIIFLTDDHAKTMSPNKKLMCTLLGSTRLQHTVRKKKLP